MRRYFYRLLLVLTIITLHDLNIFAQVGYYDSINVANPTFVTDLKERIRRNYTKVSYDLFDETNVTNYASYHKTDTTRGVRCVYSNYEHIYSSTFTWGTMSREHTWCHSWMPTYSSTSGNEYSDQHHLFPTHQNGANGVRSNHPLGIVATVTSSFLEGKYGKDANNNNVYEPRDQHKGDAARAILYMALRYDGVNGNSWNFNWLNSVRLPFLNEAPQDINTLIQWHQNDPPDAWEIGRNDYIYSIQNNRNPFIDHPEYVNYIDFNDMTYKSSNSKTTVSFASAGATKNEFDGSYSITVNIYNRSETNPTTTNVVLISGNAGSIGNFTSQALTFPANSSAAQLLNINISDDDIEEDDEEFIFELQNVAGGDSAEIGNNPTFRLTVVDNERRLMITEISDATRFTAEFIEIFNAKNRDIDMTGYQIKQFNSSQSYTIPEQTIIPANGFLVVARDTSELGFQNYWGLTFNNNVVFLNSEGKLPQINGDEKYLLKDLSNINIDPTINNDTTFIAMANGRRIIRLNRYNTISSWQSLLLSSSTPTPGSLEVSQVLPVELTNFSVSKISNGVFLSWSTSNEVNNYGFYVEKTSNKTNSFWESIGFILGSGYSNSPQSYYFIDSSLSSGKYYYRLKQVDNDGQYAYSPIVHFDNIDKPKNYALFQNYPNPFNPSTMIRYSISQDGFVTLKIYNSLGEEIKTIVNQTQYSGQYEIDFNALNLAGGVYFYELRCNDFIQVKKLVVIK